MFHVKHWALGLCMTAAFSAPAFSSSRTPIPQPLEGVRIRTADLDRFEEHMVRYINELRADPARFYRSYLPDYIASQGGRFTEPYLRSLRRDLNSIREPLPRLEPAGVLDQAAARQAAYLARFHGRLLTHEQGRLDFVGRMRQTGLHCFAENLYQATDPSALQVVCDLLIDQGIPSLGHRRNLLSRDYDLIGFSTRKVGDNLTLVVMDFGCRHMP